LLDSRKIYSPATSLFFALKGPRRDGHQFIPELYRKGIRNFIISGAIDTASYPDGNFVTVNDTLTALQQLATWHRNRFNIPVIGLTGSNGKTIVKEWLYQLLHEDYAIVRSPKSYNSQTGVPLSVWQMDGQHTLGIFEAGISQPGEMEKLEPIIRPTIGILTNLGEAHSEGFSSATEKALEKIKLFSRSSSVVYCRDNTGGFDPEQGLSAYRRDDIAFYSWSRQGPAWLTVTAVHKEEFFTRIEAENKGQKIAMQIPFTDDASVENAVTCWCVLLQMGVDHTAISERMKGLQPVNMRLELKKGINQCTLINDSYSADLSSLEIALNFLAQQGAASRKTVILSDFVQTAMDSKELYGHIVAELIRHGVSRLIGIGEKITRALIPLEVQHRNSPAIELHPSTSDFVQQFRSSQFKEETILIKGARIFGFEEIVQLLEQKVHQTVLEINLNAIAHNLKEYQRLLEPSTKIMAMVKAFAYGSGGAEIAGVLQYHKVDYLGVAYVDEGVELRKAGISLPILVLNPEEITFDALVEYNLEPDIYSFELLRSFDRYLKREGIQHYPVHTEIETGMNRLGFDTADMEQLAAYFRSTASFAVQSAFSHLAASEEPEQDEFTFLQREKFLAAAAQLEKELGYSFLKHIANSAAVVRHPSLQLDMVRLGIGLYGINSAETNQPDLQPVAALRSTIAQLKHLKAGESVSYNRKGVVKRDSVIATVRIGYADGFSRRLGNGKGKIWVKSLTDGQGRLAPVIGTVCMDMTMIDVTDTGSVKEGDEVIIFGRELPLQQLAGWAGTIPYEIMTGISQRVKRVYFEE
jgi:Alr-MurF fusion protein